jgi:NADPH2:quinone reductase
MAEPLACAVLGMRCLGPVFGDPVVVIGAGTMGLLLLLARGRVLLLSWTGSASGWRSPRKLGAARAVTDAGALDGHASRSRSMRRGAGGDRDRVGLLGHGGRVVVCGVPPAPAAISVSPFRVYSDKIVITGPMAILRSFGPAGRRV